MGLQASKHNQPSRNFAPITASDATLLPTDARGIVCLTAGNCVAQNFSGVSVTFAMTAGMVLPISPQRVMAASTGTYAVLR